MMRSYLGALAALVTWGLFDSGGYSWGLFGLVCFIAASMCLSAASRGRVK